MLDKQVKMPVLGLGIALLVMASMPGVSLAQRGGGPRPVATIEPDPRVEQRSYRFTPTDEELTYVLFVSSKVSRDKENPLIVALHGLGGDGNFLVRDRLVDFAEDGGYVVVGPLGYNVAGWYGSPVIAVGGRGGNDAVQGPDPSDLARWSEQDVMNVLAMARDEFNIDDDRTYLMGHSMGGAGALFLGQKHVSQWAAVAALAPAAFRMEQEREAILSPLREAGVPLMIIQGDMDTAVPVESARRWAETMAAIGMRGEYIELAGGDHATVKDDGMPDMYRLFEGSVRGRP